MLRDAKRRASETGVPFSLGREDIHIGVICPALRVPFDLDGPRTSPMSPTLDRINPSRGYVPDNVVVISNKANRAKSDLTPMELGLLLEYVEALH